MIDRHRSGWLVRGGLLFSLALLCGCTVARPPEGARSAAGLEDGVYEGQHRHGLNSAVVRVTVRDGRIADVQLVKHFSSWIGKRVNEVIPRRIVEQQSTQVDAVTGATNSSNVIMQAARNALEKAGG